MPVIVARYASRSSLASARRVNLIVEKLEVGPLRFVSRSSVILAILGLALMFIGTWVHPSDADPNDALAAFSE